jgi:type VI secretion system protein ImpM
VTGYFGKVSTHGDFVSRRLPSGLVEAWDGWLQQCIEASRVQLGDRWLNHYLISPVWRFAISPGVLGPDGLGGVMMPSVDRVGRYFPLMIGATGAPPLLEWAEQHAAWFDALDDLARESLAPAFTLDRFDTAPEPVWQPSSAPASAPDNAALQGHSLWWTEGSPGIDASPLVCRGMPPPQAFAAMLDGSWAAPDDHCGSSARLLSNTANWASKARW